MTTGKKVQGLHMISKGKTTRKPVQKEPSVEKKQVLTSNSRLQNSKDIEGTSCKKGYKDTKRSMIVYPRLVETENEDSNPRLFNVFTVVARACSCRKRAARTIGVNHSKRFMLQRKWETGLEKHGTTNLDSHCKNKAESTTYGIPWKYKQ